MNADSVHCRRAACAPALAANINFMTENQSSPKGWYSRGYLPHFDGGEIWQFVTYRLFDSLPQSMLEHWRLELEHDQIPEAGFRRRVEEYLDQSCGSCFLQNENIAEMVQENLLNFDGQKYQLRAWVIMPNHVHLLLKPKECYHLEEIMHSIKSYTAHRANKILHRAGQFWFRESFDRYIRNYEHFEKTVAYIENNPVKARLCEKPEDWRFGSAGRAGESGSAGGSPAPEKLK